MPERVSIFVEGAPSAFGHYSQVIKLGNSVHISGQLPIDPATNKLISPEVDVQARSVFQSLTNIMQACSGQLSNIMSTRLYLVDFRDYKAIDQISKEFFYFVPPARTIIMVAGLPFGARVQIDATAELQAPDTLGKRLL